MKYLALIAVDQQRVVLLVQGNLHDGVHNNIWDLYSLGALHFDDAVAYAVGCHELPELGREFRVDEGTAED